MTLASVTTGDEPSVGCNQAAFARSPASLFVIRQLLVAMSKASGVRFQNKLAASVSSSTGRCS